MDGYNLKKLVISIVALLAGASTAAADSSTSPGKPNVWACHGRTADNQCIVTVSIGNNFPEVEKQTIRRLLVNFSESPNIEAIEAQGGNSDVSIINGCYKSECGFLTDLRTRKVYISISNPQDWSGYCCDPYPGQGVYCHEMMHAIAGTQDWQVPLRQFPSCFNGTLPWLGIEDFADIAATYPLPGK